MYTSIAKELLLQWKKSQLESKKNVFIEFISNLDIFSLFSPRDIVIIKEMTFDTENYRSMWRQIHSDVINKNNNVSFKNLAIHYH
jgi:hypothetical protein